jgi:coproporphyrinogen III oxidase
MEENKSKNVKISEKHHEILKTHCEKNGLKIYKVLEKWIEDYCKPKKKDIYGD